MVTSNRAQQALSPITPRRAPGTGETTPYLITPGSQEFEQTATGLRAKLTFFVEDKTGAGPRVLVEALYSPQIPQMDTHFDGIDTLFPSRRHVTNVEDCNTKWLVTITYGFPEVSGGPFYMPPTDQNVPVLELDSSVVMKRTNIALKGENDAQEAVQIQGYRGLVYDENGVPTGFKEKPEPDQGGMVDVPAVVTVLRYMRRELPVDSRNRGIAVKARRFVGRSNDRILAGDAMRTWLCSRIGTSSDDSGLSYNMTYEFMYNADTWDPLAVYIDPKTGQPGDGVGYAVGAFPLVPGTNGLKTFRVTRMENFEDLDLQI